MAHNAAKPTGKSIPPPLPSSGDRSPPPPLPSERLAPPPLPKVQVEGHDASTQPGRAVSRSDSSVEVDVADLEAPSVRAAHSIDKLLALTGESWDVDDQVRTLQAASVETRPLPPIESQSRPIGPSLALPTPYDIGKQAPEGGRRRGEGAAKPRGRTGGRAKPALLGSDDAAIAP